MGIQSTVGVIFQDMKEIAVAVIRLAEAWKCVQCY